MKDSDLTFTQRDSVVPEAVLNSKLKVLLKDDLGLLEHWWKALAMSEFNLKRHL